MTPEAIFDTHAHYDDRRFDADRDLLLSTGLSEAGISKVMNVAADKVSVDAVNSLSLQYENVYAALGIHPSEISDLTEDDMEHIKDLASSNAKVRAIGEAGLDYHYEGFDRDEQERWFVRQIELAKDTDLPIIVHSRDAAADTMRIISGNYTGREEKVNGVIHCFSYSVEEAVRYVDLGFMIGIGGVVTYKNGRKLKEVVKEIPLDKLVLETDCPYLAPEPHRGERNSSLFLPFVVRAMSEIKGVSEAEIAKATCVNAMRLYAIS